MLARYDQDGLSWRRGHVAAELPEHCVSRAAVIDTRGSSVHAKRALFIARPYHTRAQNVFCPDGCAQTRRHALRSLAGSPILKFSS